MTERASKHARNRELERERMEERERERERERGGGWGEARRTNKQTYPKQACTDK